MGDHEVSGDILARFAARTATGEEERQVLRHLLAGCRKCLCYLRLGDDETLTAAEHSLKDGIERQELSVRGLVEEVDALPPEEREFKVRNLRRYAVAELALAFVEKSHELRFRDTDAMLHHARLAVAVAEAAAGVRRGDQALLADCSARSWAQLGNAHRTKSQLGEAERCLATALRHLENGSGRPEPRAWVLRCLAPLRAAQRAFREAAQLHDETAAIYRRLHDRTGEATALIGGAQALLCAGDPAPAIPPLQRALAILQPWTEQERALLRVTSISLVCCYIDIGCVQRAYDLVSMAEDHFEDCPDRIAQFHWKWQRGKVDRERGDFFAANQRLNRVYEGLLENQLPEQTGEVLLDLAILYARQGRRKEFLRAMADAAVIFHSLGARREFLAALAQLGKMAEANQAAEGLLRQLVLQCRGGVERAES